MYYPIVVYLNAKELAEYERLSHEISKNLTRDRKGKYKLNQYGEMLALQRSRVIAGANQKLDSLKEHIKPYVKDNNSINFLPYFSCMTLQRYTFFAEIAYIMYDI